MNWQASIKRAIGMLLLACLAACGSKSALAPSSFTQGLTEYLQQRGNLCLAKYDWPIDISADEFAMGSRNAVQMPVLQKLGLVSVSDASVEQKTEDATRTVAVKRYQLTDAGAKFYAPHTFISAAGGIKVERSDVCVAKLSLDTIVAVEKLDARSATGSAAASTAASQVSVSYTYHVDAAPWTRDADFEHVFPMIERVIQGDGKLPLKETFEHTAGGWVAGDLLR